VPGRGPHGDATPRERVEQLLVAAAETEGILSGGAVGALETAAPESLAAGDVLAGRFKFCQKLGASGMGGVWVAGQAQPLHRLIPLKVIRRGGRPSLRWRSL
jgi:hypothetical protein